MVTLQYLSVLSKIGHWQPKEGAHLSPCEENQLCADGDAADDDDDGRHLGAQVLITVNVFE